MVTAVMFRPKTVSYYTPLATFASHTLVSCRILLLELANPLKELLGSALLKETHERRAQSFSGIGGHLGHGRLGTLALLNIAAGDLLELEISGDIGGDQNVCQLSVGHQQLGNQVNVPVVDSAVLLPGLLPGGNIAVLLEQLQRRSVGTLSRSIKLAYCFNVHRGCLSITIVSYLPSVALYKAPFTYPP